MPIEILTIFMRTFRWKLNTQSNKSFLDLFIILLFIAINIFLKSLYLGTTSIWLDESATVNFSLHSFKEILEISLVDPNGPLFQFLLKIWISIFGISETSIRILPMLFGSLTIWPLFLLAKKMFNRGVAINLLLIYTLSNTIIYYSHETRPYTLIVFLSVFSFYYFYKTVMDGRMRDFLLYILINTLLLYTHLTPISIFFIQFLVSILYLKAKFKNVLFVYAGMAVSMGIFAIWFLNNNWFGGGETIWVEQPNMKIVLRLFSGYFNSTTIVYVSLGLMLLFFLGNLLAKQKFTKIKEMALVLMWGLLPIIITYVVSLIYNPRFLPRYMICTLPALYLAVAVFLWHTTNIKWIGVLLSIAFLILFGREVRLNQGKSELWPETVSFVKENKDENTIVAICAFYQHMPFSYYYDKEIFKDYENRIYRLSNDHVYAMCASESIMNKLSELHDKSKLILVLSHEAMVDKENKELNYFLNNYYLENSRSMLKGIRVFVFDLSRSANDKEIVFEKDKIDIEAKEFNGIYGNKFSEISINTITSAKVSCTIRSDHRLDDAILVICTRGNGERDFWKGINLKSVKPGSDCEILEKVYLPTELAESSDFATYVWQPKEKKKFQVINIKIVLK
ncbi:MAG: glycosyltransferase family 39 protein [Bacteroidota bacterium]|nr:glycosyltransferase family 39 protein [Bacteroidota bacterium]